VLLPQRFKIGLPALGCLPHLTQVLILTINEQSVPSRNTLSAV
jgi:hypothetical protein